ncbi:MAG TPA: COX15/CtaA family protein [Pseudolysinimonas sp.]|nr:COX15/CtaA family protein [Pseudolysinimonas sp.]
MSLFPSSIADRRVRVLAWLSLVVNIAIIGTGGAVRLTGSGLGCPTWPTCTEDSFVVTPEMGIHGVIEFGNRTLTGVLMVVAILTFLSVIKLWRTRRSLVVIAFLLGLGIPLQALVGGVTVLTNLNPYVVGLHFVVSIAMVALATIYLWRVCRGQGRAVPGWFVVLGYLLAVLVAITVLMGILTTGSGPHAGDAGAARNGLDPGILQHVHSWPAYTVAGLTVVLLAISLMRGYPWRLLAGLLAAEVAQVAVGITQARLGLPEPLVGTHMVLAAVTTALTVTVILALRSQPAESAASAT